MKRLAVLVSGTGSNLESIINAKLPVELVLADRPCRGIYVAKSCNIKAIIVDRRKYGYAAHTTWDRPGFTDAVSGELEDYSIDLIAMAGFMTVLAPTIFTKFEDRILNTHPSLLPKFKGARAVPKALASGVQETGVTVHVATAALDSGAVLAQERVPVLVGDTEDTLQERIKKIERQLYPKTIREYLSKMKAIA